MTAGWHGLLGTETQGATWKRDTENDQKIPQQDFWPVFFTLFALLIFIQLFRAALGSALQSMGLPGVLVKRNSATMRGKSQFLLVCHIYYAYVPTHQNLSFKNCSPFFGWSHSCYVKVPSTYCHSRKLLWPEWHLTFARIWHSHIFL